MTVTILAILFLVLVVFVAFAGSRLLGGKSSKSTDLNSETCSVCRGKFKKEALVLRQIGDYKLLYFCRDCILKLYAELGLKN